MARRIVMPDVEKRQIMDGLAKAAKELGFGEAASQIKHGEKVIGNTRMLIGFLQHQSKGLDPGHRVRYLGSEMSKRFQFLIGRLGELGVRE